MTDETKGDGMTLEKLKSVELFTRCKNCNGTGQAYVEVGTISGGYFDPPEVFRELDACPECNGSGYSPIDTHLAAQSAMRGDEAKLESMCQAFYENKGSMKWEKLLECWKENYRDNMRAALQAAIGGQP